MGIVVGKIAFWSFVALFLYTHLGYPMLAMLLARYRGNKGTLEKQPNKAIETSVTVIVAAYNEEAVIADRLANLSALNYPPTHLEIIVASDGSTDRTNEIVSAWPDPRVRLLALPRGGKAVAVKRATSLATGEILVITDADTFFQEDFLFNLVLPFSDPKVGCVVGRLVYKARVNTVAEDTGLYWRFETKLREWESDAGLLAVGTGCCMAVRRDLYVAPHPDEAGDDAIPLNLVLHGHHVVFARKAVAVDITPCIPQDEIRARARNTVLGMTAIRRRKALLNPFHFPLTALALFSHRVLRFLTPVFVLGALLSNVLLAREPLYFWALLLQLAFYATSIIGWLAWEKTSGRALFRIPVSFCIWNIGFATGLFKVLRGKSITTWKPA